MSELPYLKESSDTDLVCHKLFATSPSAFSSKWFRCTHFGSEAREHDHKSICWHSEFAESNNNAVCRSDWDSVIWLNRFAFSYSAFFSLTPNCLFNNQKYYLWNLWYFSPRQSIQLYTYKLKIFQRLPKHLVGRWFRSYLETRMKSATNSSFVRLLHLWSSLWRLSANAEKLPLLRPHSDIRQQKTCKWALFRNKRTATV